MSEALKLIHTQPPN